MKRIFSALLVLCSIVIIISPLQTSAIVADYESLVPQQQAEADMHLAGEVTSAEYKPDNTVDYQLRVERIYRNDNRGEISPGTILYMQHNCDMASEMYHPSTEAQCVKIAPKIGDNKDVYLKYHPVECIEAPCLRYVQSVIYEDSLIDYQSPQLTTLNNTLVRVAIIAGASLLVIAAVATIFILKKKKLNK